MYSINVINKCHGQIDFESKSHYQATLYVDGANGVGALKARTLAQLLASPSADDQCIHGQQLSVDATTTTHHHRPAKYHLNLQLFNEDVATQHKLNHLVIIRTSHSPHTISAYSTYLMATTTVRCRSCQSAAKGACQLASRRG